MTTRNPDIFNGAELKVERAYSHIDELERVIREFSASQFYEIVMAQDPGGQWLPLVRPLKEVPKDLPLIIGDIAHNLRSALEHLVYAIIPARETTFPMHETEKNFVSDRAKFEAIEAALPGAERLFLDRVQSHTGGKGELLYALHCLDRVDKHHKILVTTSAAIGGNFLIIHDGEIRFASRGIRFNPNQTTHLPVPGPWSSDTKVLYDNKAALEVFFGEPAILREKAVFPTLLKAAENVRCVIREFRSLLS